ncbi:hypothetical protein CEE69_24405 [Rhodopirellula bahusiensis]|uniref:Uncharacterized protein n=2 Tax=Rhodopirellula bahusiensis TaxID=2014065 RepID=A0A2G1W139_9BACT|nr:hypothetical protein CEE69_24405 [Rhodopirellula bahusiensis]
MIQFDRRRLFVWTVNAGFICIATFVVSAILLTSARWSGRFMLQIDIELPPDVERESLVYMECWDEQIADWLCTPGNQVKEGFEPPSQRTTNRDIVVVSTGGKSSALRIFDTYHQPETLVLQYDRVATLGQRETLRTLVPIPKGRGDRSVSIDLKQEAK